MKKWFKKRKVMIYILLFMLGLFSSYQFLVHKKIILHNKEIVDFVLNNSFENKNIFKKIEKITISKNQMFSLLKSKRRLSRSINIDSN